MQQDKCTYTGCYSADVKQCFKAYTDDIFGPKGSRCALHRHIPICEIEECKEIALVGIIENLSRNGNFWCGVNKFKCLKHNNKVMCGNPGCPRWANKDFCNNHSDLKKMNPRAMSQCKNDRTDERLETTISTMMGVGVRFIGREKGFSGKLKLIAKAIDKEVYMDQLLNDKYKSKISQTVYEEAEAKFHIKIVILRTEDNLLYLHDDMPIRCGKALTSWQFAKHHPLTFVVLLEVCENTFTLLHFGKRGLRLSMTDLPSRLLDMVVIMRFSPSSSYQCINQGIYATALELNDSPESKAGPTRRRCRSRSGRRNTNIDGYWCDELQFLRDYKNRLMGPDGSKSVRIYHKGATEEICTYLSQKYASGNAFNSLVDSYGYRRQQAYEHVREINMCPSTKDRNIFISTFRINPPRINGPRKVKFFKRGITELNMLPEKELWDILDKQNYKCFYTGIPLSPHEKTNWRLSRERIDPGKGYAKDNVCFICMELQTAHTQWSRKKVLESIDLMGKSRPISKNDISTDLLNFTHRIYGGMKKRQRDRKGNSMLTLNQFVDKYITQGGLCAYSGIRMTFNDRDRASDTLFYNISPERLDNRYGYTNDNVVLICLCFNVADWGGNRDRKVENWPTSQWNEVKWAAMVHYIQTHKKA